jgi:hypothetical protein
MSDKLNGVATVQKSANANKESVLFKDGMRINLDKDISWGTYRYVIFSALVM